jgi:hypothetical protein
MSHPIQTWFNRHISDPLNRTYDRIDPRQHGSTFDELRPARPTPTDVSWMPMPHSHARNDHNQGR